MADRFIEHRAHLPSSYVSFVENHGGWEGDLGDDLGYVVLWDPATLQERDDGYEISRSLTDRWFAFGSNGGGEMLCFDLSSGTDRVYWISFIGMSDDDALLRYDSFAEIASAMEGAIESEA